MKLRTLGANAAVAALTSIQVPAYGIDTGIEWLNLSGFGSLVAAHADIGKDQGAYFSPSLTTAKGIRNSVNYGSDSKLGLNATATVNSQLSVTAQFITRRHADNSYRPVAERANVKYEFTPDISVRVGRVGMPAFLISDYLFVGYSQPWIRPPVDAYRLMPLSHVDGGDAIFRFHADEMTVSIQPVIGKTSAKFWQNGRVGEAKVNDVLATNIMLEYGPWTGRYGFFRGTSDATGFAAIKDRFNNIGLVYDKDAWLVQGEYIWRTTNELPMPVGNINEKMGYVTVGYRIGKVMPNFTYSRFLDQSPNHVNVSSQDTRSLGVRWDFYKSMAFKAQWDNISRRQPSPLLGYLGQFNYDDVRAPFLANDKDVNVVSVGVDFVF